MLANNKLKNLDLTLLYILYLDFQLIQYEKKLSDSWNGNQRKEMPAIYCR